MNPRAARTRPRASAPPAADGRGARRLAPFLAGLVAACIGSYPQRLPGPLPLSVEEPAVLAPPLPGIPAATLQRESGPVWIRSPGERGYRELPFYRKRERAPAGALVRTGAGGRAEILWSPDATTVALFDEARVTLGDPQRDEPLVRFHALTRALLVLTPEDRVELVGGALLRGDSQRSTGPILLKSAPGAILRLTNQSKLMAKVEYRTENLELGPGESLDLPVLPGGAGPREAENEPTTLDVAGFPVTVRGRCESSLEGGGVSLTALGEVAVTALGIEAHLDERARLRLSGLSPRGGAPAPDP